MADAGDMQRLGGFLERYGVQVSPPIDGTLEPQSVAADVEELERRIGVSCASELRIVADVFASEPLDECSAQWFVRRVLDVADRLDGKA